MNSFDVFDTLLARRYITSDPIWDHIEDQYSIPGFATARKSADNGSRNLYEIYDILVGTSVIDQSQRNQLFDLELRLEKETCFPVQENIDRVSDGDMLISDMYLPASAILELVRSVGLTKQVTLYQSNGDKSQGSVYKKFREEKPGIHLGDNRRSDYEQARANGINGEWYLGTGLNEYESQFNDRGMTYTALLCREVRLRNNTIYRNYFDVACGINLPWLLICAEMLHRKYKDRNLVFLGRDCQLMYKIYSAYYGGCYYLPFSRSVAFNQPGDAVNYLLTHSPENPLFVDISSTGGTWAKLDSYSKLEIVVAIYSDLAYYTPDRPVPPQTFTYLTTNTQVGPTNLLLEVFNCGDHGHLKQIEVIDGKLMQVKFGDPELPQELINTIQQPVNTAIDLAIHYRSNIREELAGLTDEELFDKFKSCVSYLCGQQSLAEQLPQSFRDKEFAYLHQFTNRSL
jgi:hypothetical protein